MHVHVILSPANSYPNPKRNVVDTIKSAVSASVFGRRYLYGYYLLATRHMCASGMYGGKYCKLVLTERFGWSRAVGLAALFGFVLSCAVLAPRRVCVPRLGGCQGYLFVMCNQRILFVALVGTLDRRYVLFCGAGAGACLCLEGCR